MFITWHLQHFTGAVSHFMIGGVPDWTVFILCVVFTLIWQESQQDLPINLTPETLNRVTGIILVILGITLFLDFPFLK